LCVIATIAPWKSCSAPVIKQPVTATVAKGERIDGTTEPRDKLTTHAVPCGVYSRLAILTDNGCRLPVAC
jgi:hypothetical protein